MSITLNLMQAGKIKKSFTSTSAKHAEEVAFATAALRKGGPKEVSNPLLKTGSLTFEMDGWPCVNEKHHDCHDLFTRHSQDAPGRTITVVMTDDSGGYKASHAGAAAGHTTITYTNGVVAYS